MMEAVGDHYGRSGAFVVPLACFGIVAAYGLAWPKLSRIIPARLEGNQAH
jgi:hypothetical protein